ncbi:hypothetical protein [Endozoicomonas euniceicola]|uniref:Uncharacterized protein n=1 Tax=Endozoicomonas euniceicola TaxID=1234143 RepID=A0ABY6GU33_9GAMM|nr:hypothetical protein [Endozoicomonas euniceicola]UYM16283.1 hypothetical protein NX720_26395 [Endozoicomonas euniceicola]
MKNRNILLGIKSKRKIDYSSHYLEDMPLSLFKQLECIGKPPYRIKIVGGLLKKTDGSLSIAVFFANNSVEKVVFFPLAYLRHIYPGKEFISKAMESIQKAKDALELEFSLSSSQWCRYADLPIKIKDFVLAAKIQPEDYLLDSQVIIIKNRAVKIFLPTTELVRKLFVEKALYAADVFMPDHISNQVLYHRKNGNTLDIHLSNECDRVNLTKSKVMLLARRLLCPPFSSLFASVYQNMMTNNSRVKPVTINIPESIFLLTLTTTDYVRFSDNIFISKLDICRHKEPLPVRSVSIRHRGYYYQFPTPR